MVSVSSDKENSGYPAAPTKKGRWKRPMMYSGLALLIGLIVGQLIRLPVASIEWFGALAGTFITSPGFGGLAALTVGIFGFHAVRREFRQTKQRDETAAKLANQAATRDAKAAEQRAEGDWWKRVEWITQNTQRAAEGDGLPTAIALGTLEPLRKIAQGDVQTRACDLLYTYFKEINDQPDEVTPASTINSENNDQKQSKRLVREFLEGYKQTAEAKFENDVIDTLRRHLGDSRVHKMTQGVPADAEIRYGNKRIYVNTKWISPGSSKSPITNDEIQRLSALVGSDPKKLMLLVCSNSTVATGHRISADKKVLTTMWNPSDGDGALLTAVDGIKRLFHSP